MNLIFIVKATNVDENMGEALNEDCINMFKNLAIGFGDGNIVCKKSSDTNIEMNLSVTKDGEQTTHMDVNIF